MIRQLLLLVLAVVVVCADVSFDYTSYNGTLLQGFGSDELIGNNLWLEVNLPGNSTLLEQYHNESHLKDALKGKWSHSSNATFPTNSSMWEHCVNEIILTSIITYKPNYSGFRINLGPCCNTSLREVIVSDPERIPLTVKALYLYKPAKLGNTESSQDVSVYCIPNITSKQKSIVSIGLVEGILRVKETVNIELFGDLGGNVFKLVPKNASFDFHGNVEHIDGTASIKVTFERGGWYSLNNESVGIRIQGPQGYVTTPSPALDYKSFTTTVFGEGLSSSDEVALPPMSDSTTCPGNGDYENTDRLIETDSSVFASLRTQEAGLHRFCYKLADTDDWIELSTIGLGLTDTVLVDSYGCSENDYCDVNIAELTNGLVRVDPMIEIPIGKLTIPDKSNGLVIEHDLNVSSIVWSCGRLSSDLPALQSDSRFRLSSSTPSPPSLIINDADTESLILKSNLCPRSLQLNLRIVNNGKLVIRKSAELLFQPQGSIENTLLLQIDAGVRLGQEYRVNHLTHSMLINLPSATVRVVGGLDVEVFPDQSHVPIASLLSEEPILGIVKQNTTNTPYTAILICVANYGIIDITERSILDLRYLANKNIVSVGSRSVVNIANSNTQDGAWQLNDKASVMFAGEQHDHSRATFTGNNSLIVFKSSNVSLTRATFTSAFSQKEIATDFNSSNSTATEIPLASDAGMLRVKFQNVSIVLHDRNQFRPGVVTTFHEGTIQGSSTASILFESSFAWNVTSFSIINPSSFSIVVLREAVLVGNSAAQTSCSQSSKSQYSVLLQVASGATVSVLTVHNNCESPLDIPFRIESKGSVSVFGCVCFPFGGEWTSISSGGKSGEDSGTEQLKDAPQLPPPTVSSTSRQLESTDTLQTTAPSEVFRGGSVLLNGGHVFACAPSQGTDASEESDSSLVESDHQSDEYCNAVTGLDRLIAASGEKLSIKKSVNILVDKLVIEDSSMFSVNKDVQITGDVVVSHNSVLAITEVNDVLRIKGDLTISGQLVITINSTTTCSNTPVDVAGSVKISPTATAKCRDKFMPKNGEYVPLIRWSQSVFGDMESLSPTGCAEAASITHRIKQSNGKASVQFIIESGEIPFSPLLLMTVTIAMLLLPVLLQHGGVSGVMKDLVKRPPVRLALSWDEFRHFLPNAVVAFFMFYEVLWLGAIFLHPQVPLPHYLKKTQGWFHKWFYQKRTTGPAFAFAFTTCSVITVVWFALWLPLLPHAKSCTRSIRTDTFKRHIPKFFILHKEFTALLNFLMLPILTILLQAFNCVSEQSFGGISQLPVLTANSEIQCWTSSAHILYVVASFLCSSMFILLCYNSANYLVLHFAHPPYRTDLDIRNKRTYEALRLSILFVQVVVISVFDQEVYFLLISSLGLQVALLLLTSYSEPCAYYNVNRLRVCGLSVAVWGILTAITSCLIYGPYPLPDCDSDSDLWITIVYPLGVLLIVLSFWGIKETDAGNQYPAADQELVKRAVGIQRSLKELRRNIFQLRSEQYHSSGDMVILTGREPDDTDETLPMVNQPPQSDANNRKQIGKLLVQYSKELESFRVMKERYLMPYYLGTIPDEDTELATLEDECNDWRTIERLGSGGYGTVFKGVLPSGSLLAVKVIKGCNTALPELEIMKEMSHPHIIEYKACLVSEDKVQIFMEYAAGGSLASLVKKCPLDERAIRGYTRQLLLGLEYLHSHMIMHGDIKGSNTLIDANGVIKLADFGCSRYLLSTTEMGKNALGTFCWMAPEVLLENRYTFAADIWSVGCTTIEILNRCVYCTVELL